MITRRCRLLPSLLLLAVLMFGAAVVPGCGRSVTAPEKAPEAARAALASPTLAGPLDLSHLRGPVVGEAESLAVAIRGQGEIEAELMRVRPGIVGTAASLRDGHPVVLALTRGHVDGIPARMKGREIAEYVVTELAPTAYYCGTSTGRNDECNGGTLGAIVTDGTRNYWLSNWHVFVDQQGAAGDPVVAPGRIDVSCGTSTRVGTVSRYVPLRFDGTPNYVDCAIANIAPGVAVSPIQSAGSNSYLPSGTTKTALIGMAVKKVGRTTGFTTGTVTAVNANMNLVFGQGTAYFRGLILTSLRVDRGDSGSLICTQSGNYPVALLFYMINYNGVGCPINSVYQAIGAHIAN